MALMGRLMVKRESGVGCTVSFACESGFRFPSVVSISSSGLPPAFVRNRPLPSPESRSIFRPRRSNASSMVMLNRVGLGAKALGAGESAKVARPSRSTTAVACEASRSNTDQEGSGVLQAVGKCALGVLSAAALTVGTLAGPSEVVVPAADAALTAGDPIKNARAILRYALPIDNKQIRTVQRDLENISEIVRVPGTRSFGAIEGVARKSINIITKDREKILADVAADKKDFAAENLDQLQAALPSLIEAVKTKDKNEVLYRQQDLLNFVGAVEESMVKGFPFEVPKEYANLPQLKGRATLEMKVKFNGIGRADSEGLLTIVADGFNAPVSAGDFVDLAQKKFYNGMDIQRSDGFVVQTGRPKEGEVYVDPSTGEARLIPLEIKLTKDKEPIYELTLEDVGRYNEQPVLPFNAYGTLALARQEFENNSASSQVFFLLKESELTPSSANLLDGRYGVFGYVVEGQDYLSEMKVGDTIEYIKVMEGGENLVKPA